MKKIDIVKDIERTTGGAGFITKTALAKYMRKRKQGEIDELLDGLDFIPDGRGKKYFIPDVAEKIMSERVKSI